MNLITFMKLSQIYEAKSHFWCSFIGVDTCALFFRKKYLNRVFGRIKVWPFADTLNNLVNF